MLMGEVLQPSVSTRAAIRVGGRLCSGGRASAGALLHMPANDAVNSCFHEINWKLDGASLSRNEKNTSFCEAAVLFENYARFGLRSGPGRYVRRPGGVINRIWEYQTINTGRWQVSQKRLTGKWVFNLIYLHLELPDWLHSFGLNGDLLLMPA